MTVAVFFFVRPFFFLFNDSSKRLAPEQKMIKRRQKLFNFQEWDEWNKNKNNNSKITQWQMVIVSNGNDRPIQNDDLSSENKTYMMDDSRA